MQIKNTKQLRQSIDEGNAEYMIMLNGGLGSRKFIRTHGKQFRVENCVDGSKQTLSARQLYSNATNIGKAMRKGAFITA
jgi:hypothetical protein